EVVRLVDGVVSLRRRAEHRLAEDLSLVGMLIHVLPERRAVREFEPRPASLDRTGDLTPGSVLRLAVHERALAHAPRRSGLQRLSHGGERESGVDLVEDAEERQRAQQAEQRVRVCADLTGELWGRLRTGCEPVRD